MLEKITEDKNKNELYNSSNNILLLNHYNLSKMRRNSTSLVLEKIPNEYSKKYFPLNNKPRKSDTSKHLSNNLVLRTPKKPKKSTYVNDSLDILSTMDKKEKRAPPEGDCS